MFIPFSFTLEISDIKIQVGFPMYKHTFTNKLNTECNLFHGNLSPCPGVQELREYQLMLHLALLLGTSLTNYSLACSTRPNVNFK